MKIKELDFHNIRPWFFLTIIVFIAYLLQVIFNNTFLDIDSTKNRAYFLSENNFETILFISFLMIRGIYLQFQRPIYLLTILSFSRSANAILLLLHIFFKRNVHFFQVFVSLILVLIVSYIFFTRLGPSGIEGIDRINFLLSFTEYLKNANYLNIALGNFNPLEAKYCRSLFDYSTFVYNDGTCSSSILHSFILRGLYSYGFVGLIILLFIFYQRIKQLDKVASSKGLFMIGLVSSLSISGFVNSFFIAFFLLIALSIKRHL